MRRGSLACRAGSSDCPAAPSDMWEKPLRATARGFIHTPVVASNFGGSNGSRGPYRANLFALVFTALVLLAGGAAVGMAVTVPAAASCEACGGVLRKRLSPSFRLAPPVIVGSCGARSSPTHPITRRHDLRLAYPPSSQATLQSMRTLCIWPRLIRPCPETTESSGLRGHSSCPASAFHDCPADADPGCTGQART